jgi:hypothetical protein
VAETSDGSAGGNYRRRRTRQREKINREFLLNAGLHRPAILL